MDNRRKRQKCIQCTNAHPKISKIIPLNKIILRVIIKLGSFTSLALINPMTGLCSKIQNDSYAANKSTHI